MSSGFEQYGDDFAGASSAGQHGSQMALTRGLEGRIFSTRDYRQNVARDNARVHYGDQHHHYYRRQGEDSEMRNNPMQQLLDALSFPQRLYRFTTIEPAYRQTCQWLFETPEYTRWRNHDLRQLHHGILWLKGKPGAGKSTIIKHALEHTSAMYPDERNIYFFFNARGDKLEKCTEGLYRSLLHQIARDVPSLLRSIHTETVKDYSSTGWPLGLLRSLFREAALRLASSTKLNCYVDALDEGEDEDQIRDMVAFFEELSEAAVSKDIRLSIYFASRHYPHISVGHSEEIILDDYAGHHSDIASYVRNKLTCSQPALKEELVTEIIHRSSGVFLWVVLVVRILNTESDRGNQHRLRICLEATPKGLIDLFSGIVGDGDMDGTLLPTLLWVLFAKRSPSSLELYLAVVHCTNVDSSSSVIWDHRAVDEASIKKFITSSSRGLLQIVAPENSATYETTLQTNKGHNLVVQFIHESVREYLLGTGLLQLDPALAENLVGISNLRLARWCQNYIEQGLQHGVGSQFANVEFDATKLLVRELLSVAPFSRYAVAEILHHSEEAASRGLRVSIPFEDCLQTLLPFATALMGSSTSSFDSQQTMLHVLAGKGYPNLILQLLKRYDHTARQAYINSRVKSDSVDDPEDRCTALHLATRRRHLDVIQVLLENGADVNACDGEGDTILMYAFEYQLFDVMQTVLRYGADANIEDISGNTALSRAIVRGRFEAFRTLLRSGPDVNVRRGHKGVTLLMSAVSAEQPAMVEALLAHGSDVNASDNTGTTALHMAAQRRGSGIVLIDKLLQHNADVNVRDEHGTTPLILAVLENNMASTGAVELLLNNGANVNTVGFSNTTALSIAVDFEHVEVIKLLLAHGADVYRERGEFSIMDAAPAMRNHDIARLLAHFADVPPGARSEAARTLEHQEWWKDYLRRNKVR